MPKRSHSVLPICLVATLIGFGLVSSAQAGRGIAAYRDETGKVIFINETPANETSTDPVESNTSAPPQSSDGTDKTNDQANQDRPKPVSTVSAAFQSTWDEMIQRTAKRYQVDPNLVRAIVQVESNFDPYAVSSRGARGLMQLIPATARRFGVGNVFDPRANLDGGVRYLKYLMNLFGGDLRRSLAAYNAGENAVDRHNGVPPYQETQDYLRKISELYPLSSSVSSPGSSAPVVSKYLDSNGIVHFSNTDLP